MNLFGGDAPPFVSRPASEARSRRLQYTGKWSDHRLQVMSYLLGSGTRGSTWKEVSDDIGGHHGQISSILSTLHQNGYVFSIRETRNGCHPYVHHAMRNDFTDEEVFDSPAETKAGIVRRAHTEFANRIRELVSATDYANESQSTAWQMDNLVEGLREALVFLDDSIE